MHGIALPDATFSLPCTSGNFGTSTACKRPALSLACLRTIAKVANARKPAENATDPHKPDRQAAPTSNPVQFRFKSDWEEDLWFRPHGTLPCQLATAVRWGAPKGVRFIGNAQDEQRSRWAMTSDTNGAALPPSADLPPIIGSKTISRNSLRQGGYGTANAPPNAGL